MTDGLESMSSPPRLRDKRFPFAPYPKGWFQVAYSREDDRGDVIGLHYFGRRLICYRGDSGTPYVLDAYCPHLGADIAVGGTVDDDCVVCPFHGWRFDGSGSNVEIPYAKTVNRTARLRAWPTAERAGIIFVWYSAEATEPEWELPTIPESQDAAFCLPRTRHGTVAVPVAPAGGLRKHRRHRSFRDRPRCIRLRRP